MNVILFGPPGAGKGTQAKFLVKKLNGFQISTGDILRDEIKKNSEIGKKIVDNMNEGKFVDDEIVNELSKLRSQRTVEQWNYIEKSVELEVFCSSHKTERFLFLWESYGHLHNWPLFLCAGVQNLLAKWIIILAKCKF